MPAMPVSQEAEDEENYEFKWGIKRGIGGKKKDVQFYESFSYDGVEYSLYDCVYLYSDGEPEPYIGKLIKIWEQDHKKRVKILWFFRPVEILNWLGEDLTLENEIFLASGEGVGLANVNALEAIAGKCNVICTSKDSRNQQPTEEELKGADYIFYRTFDVGNRTVLDTMGEKIAGVEVKYLLNRRDGQKFNGISKSNMFKKEENGDHITGKEAELQQRLNSSGELKNVNMDNNSFHPVAKDVAVVCDFLFKQEPSTGEELISGACAQLSKTAIAGVKDELVLHEKDIPITKTDSHMDDSKVNEIRTNKNEDKEKLKSAKNLGGLDDRPPNFVKCSSLPPEKRGISFEKKRKFDSEVKASETTASSSMDKTKSKCVQDSLGLDKVPAKKMKTDKMASKLSNGALPTAALNVREDIKSDGKVVEVTRRPDDRSKWFKGLPWEERMQTAHEQGTLVMLENLDPAYTSAEVEDIVWHAFGESCTARVIQRTAISSPHSGLAFVIFKTKEAAEMAVEKLDNGCLMLSNGRPLVGSIGTPELPRKQSKFPGHLVIDKIKLQMQREEMRRAVSTSHCSQPNTVEYEMAMEWDLLHARSESWWNKLYKKHGEELRNLKANLKSK